MFVEWYCGCVGLLLGEKCYVLYTCDDVDCTPYTFMERSDVLKKEYKPLTPESIDCLVKAISTLIADGYRLRKIKNLLS